MTQTQDRNVIQQKWTKQSLFITMQNILENRRQNGWFTALLLRTKHQRASYEVYHTALANYLNEQQCVFLIECEFVDAEFWQLQMTYQNILYHI